jgi:hypothetical protein
MWSRAKEFLRRHKGKLLLAGAVAGGAAWRTGAQQLADAI